MTQDIYQKMIDHSRDLSDACNKIVKTKGEITVYNPLEYAFEGHRLYLEKYCRSEKKHVFIGMNPGPWGMAQTGVPFGEIALVKEWLGIECEISKPDFEHPKKPVDGFFCKRSEVSGRRLWGYVKDRFQKPELFFNDFFIYNYCPVMFLSKTGANLTPDKLSDKKQRDDLYKTCDIYLKRLAEILKPETLIGVGNFAEVKIRNNFSDKENIRILKVLHPSPANPHANRGWSKFADGLFEEIATA